uniref:Uncharacterized protein n=1 Tax=Arundo donax TaxID=35708 RepID=A0A0A9DPU7_ARUDO
MMIAVCTYELTNLLPILFRCRSPACDHILCSIDTDFLIRINKPSKLWKCQGHAFEQVQLCKLNLQRTYHADRTGICREITKTNKS